MADSQIPEDYDALDQKMENNNRRYGEIEEVIDDVERAFEKFQNFEILNSAPYDHCFLSKRTMNCRRSNLTEQMKQEWKVLKFSLAKSSIYVRAYEERPDLMRAIIVGPEGTPYHHALFCFDFRFPSNYPNQTPDLFYRCYYAPSSIPNGKLKGFLNLKMKSHSAPMTILRLLTLIQNSFLINKHDEAPRVPSAAEEPNMRVMKQTWEAMLCMLKSPPQNFEVFVQGYFRTRSHQILMNFKFRIGLDETTIGLFFRLIKAFEANGAYCQHHYNKDNVDQLLLKAMLPRQKSNSGIVKKISTMFQGTFL
ncbi:putative ubiquitin-conjugating enzyme E2 38 [Neltuma alba]|uniref:putative ubiquitin-conjugating enzyme E2 38 n=1 Tax=Neltuma alba TaxID=207710 RepID=UPI0010A3151E|nr:putative ubiquitin-conjugating enzyme E2 38 [Prosopis alba]XP_028797041.1 putative ubiquitin-conjugating enzyme E2 38 [Prosopis alba]